MPRKPRVFLPSVPCHVISRGNNRDMCFYTDQDSTQNGGQNGGQVLHRGQNGGQVLHRGQNGGQVLKRKQETRGQVLLFAFVAYYVVVC